MVTSYHLHKLAYLQLREQITDGSRKTRRHRTQELIIQGIEEGLRVGYDARAATLKQNTGI